MTDKKLAIVTGGGAGIGRAIAMRVAEDGMAVIIADLNGPGAKMTADLINDKGGRARPVIVDITDDTEISKLVEQAGNIDLLVNNAGIFHVVPFDRLRREDFRRMYEVNLVAMFRLSQLAASRMRRGSSIVNLASRAMLGAQQYIDYASSKAAVVGFTKSLALELAPKGITVNAVAPGVIETEMLRERNDTNLDALRAMQPGGTLGRPEDIAEAVRFLGSTAAKFVTGQVLLVDGGRSLGGSLGI